MYSQWMIVMYVSYLRCLLRGFVIELPTVARAGIGSMPTPGLTITAREFGLGLDINGAMDRFGLTETELLA